MGNIIEMKTAYCEALLELARKDDRICIINSDSRNISGTKPFEQEFPERSFNVGIAEADMVGIAAGLSVSGKKPFLSAFGPFMTRRVMDQVAISLAYSKLNAVLMGLSPGIMAEINGGTHQGYEDIAAMRCLPNTTIVEPLDSVQLTKMLPELIKCEGPVYVRLERANTEVYYDDDYKFELGKADILKKGKDVTLISSGIMLRDCLDAAKELESQGIVAGVINMHTIKPIDKEAIIKAAQETGKIVTVENHTVMGGLGSAVCEVTADECPIPVIRLGIQDRFGEVGSRTFLKETFGIDKAHIIDAVKKICKK